MNVMISNYPEELEFPTDIEENVRAAAEKVGELYGVENGEGSVTLRTSGRQEEVLPVMNRLLEKAKSL